MILAILECCKQCNETSTTWMMSNWRLQPTCGGNEQPLVNGMPTRLGSAWSENCCDDWDQPHPRTCLWYPPCQIDMLGGNSGNNNLNKAFARSLQKRIRKNIWVNSTSKWAVEFADTFWLTFAGCGNAFAWTLWELAQHHYCHLQMSAMHIARWIDNTAETWTRSWSVWNIVYTYPENYPGMANLTI